MQASIGTMQNYMKQSMDELYQLMMSFKRKQPSPRTNPMSQNKENNLDDMEPKSEHQSQAQEQ